LRRIFALLLATPLLANCSPDSTAPLAASGAVHSTEEAPAEEAWPAEENWYTPEDVLMLVEDDETSVGTMSTMAEGDLSTLAVGTAAAPAPAPGPVMVLGNANVGSPFPNSHDASWHANDKILPGAMVISAGQTVTFKIVFGHRLAVYNNGVQPKDIVPTPNTPLLLYPKGRLFLQGAPTPQIKLKFVKPGKYLVLCAINKHFFEGRMWAWLHVE
jgi:plastocyanin